MKFVILTNHRHKPSEFNYKELIRLLSVEGHPTKTVLVQACMGVFFIRS
jgi:hypothetical protein